MNESNANLRRLVDDQREAITNLEQKVTALEKKVARQGGEIEKLQHRNSSLEDFIVKALTKHFERNPNDAIEINKKVSIQK